jgi:Zn-dependent protease
MASEIPAAPMSGSFRMFRLAGITVFLHWSWLLVAAFELQSRTGAYTSPIWNVVEYLALFAIVLMHEFGHALACRQVGGRADRIVLWPLGGIAFIAPPPRPGALLWSIVAGPLVNVVLLPVTLGINYWLHFGAGDVNPDVQHFAATIAWINFLLLFLNLLPVYPLDGGQILQALLWFVIGRVKSLIVVSVIGLVTGVTVVAVALAAGEWWYVVLAGFVAFQSYMGFGRARQLARAMDVPRRTAIACPACQAHPPAAPVWVCSHCRTSFDIFAEGGRCPGCGANFATVNCTDCGRQFSLTAWANSTRGEPWVR